MKNEFTHHPKHHHPDDRNEERHHFPPQHQHHDYGIGSSLINIEPLKQTFNCLFKSTTDTDWAIIKSTSEGPPPVQVRNAIILVLIAQVLNRLNFSTVQTTIPVMGSSPHDYVFEYPIGLPEKVLEIVKPENREEVLSWFADSPIPEVSMDLILMNALAAIDAMLTSNTEDHENNA